MSMKFGHENGLKCRGHGLLHSGLLLPCNHCCDSMVYIFSVDVRPYIYSYEVR